MNKTKWNSLKVDINFSLYEKKKNKSEILVVDKKTKEKTRFSLSDKADGVMVPIKNDDGQLSLNVEKLRFLDGTSSPHAFFNDGGEKFVLSIKTMESVSLAKASFYNDFVNFKDYIIVQELEGSLSSPSSYSARIFNLNTWAWEGTTFTSDNDMIVDEFLTNGFLRLNLGEGKVPALLNIRTKEVVEVKKMVLYKGLGAFFEKPTGETVFSQTFETKLPLKIDTNNLSVKVDFEAIGITNKKLHNKVDQNGLLHISSLGKEWFIPLHRCEPKMLLDGEWDDEFIHNKWGMDDFGFLTGEVSYGDFMLKDNGLYYRGKLIHSAQNFNKQALFFTDNPKETIGYKIGDFFGYKKEMIFDKKNGVLLSESDIQDDVFT